LTCYFVKIAAQLIRFSRMKLGEWRSSNGSGRWCLGAAPSSAQCAGARMETWSSARTGKQTAATRELSGGRPTARRGLSRGTGRLGAAGARAPEERRRCQVEVLEVAGNKAATSAVHCRWGEIEIRRVTELQGSGNGGARRGRALLERAASPARRGSSSWGQGRRPSGQCGGPFGREGLTAKRQCWFG
jgi:hypothetical protein